MAPLVQATVFGILVALISVYIRETPPASAPIEVAPLSGNVSLTPKDLGQLVLCRRRQQSPEDLLQECEEQEVGLRRELALEPRNARLQAKLAQSLLESNGSRVVVRSERLKEGRGLVEQAVATAPEAMSTILAQVALHLAEMNTQQAVTDAQKAVGIKQSVHATSLAGMALLADACDLACRARSASYRAIVDVEGAVYPQGKDPKTVCPVYATPTRAPPDDSQRQIICLAAGANAYGGGSEEVYRSWEMVAGIDRSRPGAQPGALGQMSGSGFGRRSACARPCAVLWGGRAWGG